MYDTTDTESFETVISQGWDDVQVRVGSGPEDVTRDGCGNLPPPPVHPLTRDPTTHAASPLP